MEKQPSPGRDEDEKVRTSPHVWRHERVITGQTVSYSGNVSVMAEMCWQAEPVWAGETEQPMKEQQKLEKIIFEEVWNERPAAKGVLNGEKWKPFAEGIAKALIEAIVL